MKLGNLVWMILGIVVIYLLLEERKRSALALSASPLSKLPLPPVIINNLLTQGQQQKQEAKATSLIAQTFTVGTSPKQLPTGKPVHGEVRFSTPTGNSGSIYLAETPGAVDSGPRYSIPAGKEQILKVSELSKFWFAGTDDDSLLVYAEIEDG